MKNNFSQRKNDILSKLDKSSKGDWDKKISKLCEKINKLENYYTTSSCAGRVTLMIDQTKKEQNLFKFVEHELITFNQLKTALTKISKGNFNVKFKQEPCIIHIACKSIDDAQKIYDKAKLIGWKKSGLISFEKNFILELNSTEKLEFPIINKNKILVDDEFLELIVKKSNENLKKSWEKINKLLKKV